MAMAVRSICRLRSAFVLRHRPASSCPV